jgi:hypothetical protein
MSEKDCSGAPHDRIQPPQQASAAPGDPPQQMRKPEDVLAIRSYRYSMDLLIAAMKNSKPPKD